MAAAWALLVSALAGIATVLTDGRALVGAVAMGCLVWLVTASSWLSLGSVLIVRGLTDAIADRQIIADFNAGALIGLLLIASAGLIVLDRARSGSPVRGLIPATFIALGILYWFGIGVLRHGPDPSLIRELLRAGSILAVAMMAANADRTLSPSRLATLVVLAALVPAILVVGEAVTQWSQMVDGDLRPRGTLSHPNAASILFGIALPLSAWKWAYARGGIRYGLVAVLFLIAILLTRSMGGLAQSVVALLVFGLLQPGRGLIRVTSAAAALAVVAVFVFDPFGISRVSEIESTTLAVQEGGSANNSFEWRLVNWSRLIDASDETRLLGHGLGSTSEIVTPLGHLPHSDPIRFLVETGVIGAGLIGIGYVVMLSRLLARARRGSSPAFTTAVVAVLVGVSVHALVTHVSFNTAPMYVLAALVGWSLASMDAASEEASPAGAAFTVER